MPDRLIRWLERTAKRKTIIPLLALTLILMALVNTVNLPISVPRIEQASEGAGLLDMRIYYSPGEAYALLERLGPEGRSLYRQMLLSFDALFPALYATTFVLIIAAIFRPLRKRHPVLRIMALLPLAAGLFDWSENGAVLAMLFQYPETGSAAAFAGFLTLTKWILIGLTLAAVLAGIVYKFRGSHRADSGDSVYSMSNEYVNRK